MKLETFFGRFDELADAPGAVAKMRELVLNLAVTGRLSEQRADDAPVSELVDALRTARARRGKDGRRGAVAALVTEAVIERPIDVPAHWAWVPLKEIGAISGGMTPSKGKSAFWYGDVKWFTSKDIKTDELTDSELKITREATEATRLQVYPPGCLVMVARSGILKRTFPVSILRVEGTINQDLKVLSPFVGELERYLQIMLRGMTDFILTSLVKTGMTVQSLKYEEFEAQPFPLPPLAEQKRIVAKVDELMALCDRLEAQQQERDTRHAAVARASLARFAEAPTPANLTFIFHKSYDIAPADLRKSILTLAIQGKLVPQDPGDEPAEGLLANINRQRLVATKSKRISPMRPLPPVEEGEVVYVVRPGWALARLHELVLEIQTGPFGSSLHQSDYQIGGTPVINPASLKDGRIVPIGAMAIGPDTLKRLEVFRLNEGDIVMARRGEMGRCAIVTKTEAGWLCGTGSLVLRMPAGMYAPFLALLIGAPEAREYLGGASVGTTMQNLNQGILAKMAVGVPPVAEQRKIVAKVDHLMALVDALETQLSSSHATGTKLLEAVVAELAEAA
jgi:type I restriction enzyme S subunit